MAKITWAYCPDDRAKQGTDQEVPDDMARAYVHEGLARYARVEPEAPAEQPDTIAPAESKPAPKAKAVPEQAKASGNS